MTATVPFLYVLAACADWFITLRSVKSIAHLFEVPPAQLGEGLGRFVHPFTFRGKLQNALETPGDSPDLMAHKIHLARLEHSLSLLIEQMDRAEADVQQLKERPDCEFAVWTKAQVFANRLHQQHFRLLKEIQKAQLHLDKVASEPPQEIAKAPVHAPVQAHATAPAAPQPASNTATTPSESALKEISASEVAPDEKLAAKSSIAAPKDELANTSSSDLPGHSQPTQTQPTEEEFLQCLVRNRHRLKNTPAKNRNALMARLIEEHRANQSKSSQSKSSQNKRAA